MKFFAEYRIYIAELRGMKWVCLNYQPVIVFRSKDKLENRRFTIDQVLIKSPKEEKYAYKKVQYTSIKVQHKILNDLYKVSIKEIGNNYKRFPLVNMNTNKEFDDDLIEVKLEQRGKIFIYDPKTKSIELIDKADAKGKAIITDFILKVEG